MKTTSKVHGELMAARKSKRAARGEPVLAETVETPVVVAEPAPVKSKRARKGAAEAPAPDAAQATETTDATTDDSSDTVVFAVRLSRASRDLLHAAAGPAKASQFVRSLIIAASTGDVDGVLAIVTEAKAAKRG